MTEIQELWRSYNLITKLLKEKLGRTANIVGEYAEFLIMKFIKGKLLTASHKSADVEAPNGELYQVKSRKLSNPIGSQLGIIRSWDFDFLAVVIFDDYGNISKALKCPKSIAHKYAKENKHQNGWVITTTKSFLEDSQNTDITLELRKLNIDGVKAKNESMNSILINNKNSVEKLPVGAFVRMTFSELVEKNKIDVHEIEKLQNSEYSKAIFDIQYPFLRKVQSSDKGKVNRYWKSPINIHGNNFFICSEWFESDNNNDRQYYEKWLNRMKKNKNS